MIEQIKIGKGTQANEILMFKTCNCNKRLNLLFGGNGVGKTTFIKYITECTNNRKLNKYLKLNDKYKTFTLYSFSNRDNNYRQVGHSDRFGIDVSSDDAIRKFKAYSMSEGQSIIYSIQDFLYFLENHLPEEEGSSNVVTIDEMDSGLSVDNIGYVMDRLNKILENRKDIQMFVSFNNYAVCERNPEDILSMYTGKYIKIYGYKQFKHYIELNRDRLLKKRKNNQFTGDLS